MPPGKAISSFVIAVCFAACAATADRSSNSNSFPSVRKKILNGVRVAEREKKKEINFEFNEISSPSPSVKIQIMGRKICLKCKGKTLLSIVNKLLKTKSLLTRAMFCLITSSKLFHQPEGDGIESRLSS